MASDDDSKFETFEDEDVFDESEFEDEFNEGDDTALAGNLAAPSLQDRLKKFAIPAVAGILILAYILWKLIGLIVGGETATVQTVPTAPQMEAAKAATVQKDAVKDLIGETTEKQGAAKSFDEAVELKTLKRKKKTRKVDEVSDKTMEPSPFNEGLTITEEEKEQTLDILTRDVFADEKEDASLEQSEFKKEISDSLKKVSEEAGENNDNIQAIAEDVAEWQENFKVLGSGIKNLRTQLHELEGSLTRLTRDITYLKKSEEQSAKRRKVEMDKSSEKQKFDSSFASEYRIEAAIPGRAWIRNSEGNTITISEGDSIKHLGKVIAIDAQKGAVVTSSGIVIR